MRREVRTGLALCLKPPAAPCTNTPRLLTNLTPASGPRRNCTQRCGSVHRPAGLQLGRQECAERLGPRCVCVCVTKSINSPPFCLCLNQRINSLLFFVFAFFIGWGGAWSLLGGGGRRLSIISAADQNHFSLQRGSIGFSEEDLLRPAGRGRIMRRDSAAFFSFFLCVSCCCWFVCLFACDATIFTATSLPVCVRVLCVRASVFMRSPALSHSDAFFMRFRAANAGWKIFLSSSQ